MLAILKQVKSMGSASNGFQIAVFMKESGNLVSRMDKGRCGMRMGVATSANGIKIKNAAKDIL